MMLKVGITGGIGSGKSFISRLFAECGVAVYDSDAAARSLMETPRLASRIARRFGDEVYNGPYLRRSVLAAKVFGHPEELAALNALVHPAVIADFLGWAADKAHLSLQAPLPQPADPPRGLAPKPAAAPYVLCESALLFESGLSEACDFTIAVLAPSRERIERVCLRDHIAPEAVRTRMTHQLGNAELAARANFTIHNGAESPLQEQIEKLDRFFRDAAAS